MVSVLALNNEMMSMSESIFSKSHLCGKNISTIVEQFAVMFPLGNQYSRVALTTLEQARVDAIGVKHGEAMRN